MEEENLIIGIHVHTCPEGAFITMEICCNNRKSLVLEILDEVGARSEGLTYFYGIPFRFLNY